MNKYRNIKVTFNGINFDSKTESLFYMHLLSLQQKGEIRTIECQPVLKFPDGTKMIPDFKVVWTEPDVQLGLVETYYDVKSPATRLNKTYRLKKRLLHYFFKDINFVEVLRDRKGWKFI